MPLFKSSYAQWTIGSYYVAYHGTSALAFRYLDLLLHTMELLRPHGIIAASEVY